MSAPPFRIVRSTRFSRVGLPLLGLVLLGLALAPYWADRAGLRLLAEAFAYLALASLWNLLAGYAGLASIGQQAYVGLGAYLLFGLAMLAGVPPLATIPLAGLVAGVVAAPVALLIFRLRGAYFAIGTWVVAEVLRLLASQISPLGGGSGISLPVGIVTSIASDRQGREFMLYWLSLLLLLIVMAAIVALLRSRYGLALQSVRDNEIAAQSNGVDVWRIKLMVYCVCACGTAMLGALMFLQKLRVSPDTAFSVNDWTALYHLHRRDRRRRHHRRADRRNDRFLCLAAGVFRSREHLPSDARGSGHHHHDACAARFMGACRIAFRLEAFPARSAGSISSLDRKQIEKADKGKKQSL
jgi:branched-chain amino acid transport system permease protein